MTPHPLAATNPKFWQTAILRLATAVTLLILGADASHGAHLIYVSVAGDKAIEVLRLDDSGNLTSIQTVELPAEPGALVLAPDGRRLACALRSSGQLLSLRRDPQTGRLALVQSIAAGADPAQISTDHSGKYLFTAYYVAGKVTVHRWHENGQLDFKPVDEKATAEKAHAIMLDPQEKFAYVPHTGPDRIDQFAWNSDQGTLTPLQPPSHIRPDNTGPRHLAWHPNQPIAYVSNEQGSSASAYTFNPTTGQLTHESMATTLPKEFTLNNSTAEIRVHPSGRTLYVANRGHDSLARISLGSSGTDLLWQDTTPTEKTPRSFDVTADGKWLIAAGESSGRLAIYRIDDQDRLQRHATHDIGQRPWWVMCVAQQTTPQSIRLWEGLAPGETNDQQGTPLARRPDEDPPATRIQAITSPTLDVYPAPADKRNGCSVLILPGGAYRYVVVDKEGSEAARWLNEQGITAFVLRYRTKDTKSDPDQADWVRPVADAQQAIRWIRAHGKQWQLQPDKTGILGFSAGGQAAALVLANASIPASAAGEPTDLSPRPNFGLLIYPWRLVTGDTTELMPQLQTDAQLPPTFLIHTDDDSSTSLGSAAFYMRLKQQRVPAELHVFRSGGHGYGLRTPKSTAAVSGWPDLAARWLEDQVVSPQ